MNNYTAIYNYHDESGELLYQVVREGSGKDKRIYQRRTDGNSDWINNLGEVRRVPYRLPELLKAIETSETIYVPEGEDDCDNLAKLGLVATTNSGGAGGWNDEYATYFRGAACIVVLFDNDTPGKMLADKKVESLSKAGIPTKLISLPDLPDKKGADVSDWLAAGHTRGELLELVSEASLVEPSLHQQIRTELRKLAARNPSDLALGAEIVKIQKQFKGTRKEYLEAEYRAICADLNPTPSTPPREPTPEELEARRKDAEQAAQRAAEEQAVQDAAQQAAKELALSDDIFAESRIDLRKVGYVGDDDFLDSGLDTTGRVYLPKNNVVVYQGEPGSGKSELQKNLCEWLPPDMVLGITDFSEQVLSYMGDLSGKVIQLGEIKPITKQSSSCDDVKERLFRQFISEGSIKRAVAEKAEGEASYSAVIHETTGPCLVICTTSFPQESFDEQVRQRAIWHVSNDSEETTKKVHDQQAKRRAAPWTFSEEPMIQAKWQAYFGSLERLPVLTPWADYVKPKKHHVSMRRVFNLLMDSVEVSCLLHQKTRERRQFYGVTYLLATLEDYKHAYMIINASAPRVLDVLSKKDRESFAALVKHNSVDKVWTRREIAKEVKLTDSTCKRLIYRFLDAELIEKQAEKTSTGAEKFKLIAAKAEEQQDLGLVEPSKLAEVLKYTTIEELLAQYSGPRGHVGPLGGGPPKSSPSDDSGGLGHRATQEHEVDTRAQVEAPF